MENIEFSYLDNGKIKKIKFQELVANKRVLFCSLTRPYEDISYRYTAFLASKLEFFRDSGIDDVYFVNSTHNNFLLYAYSKRQVNSVPLLYNDNSFVEYLRVKRNLHQRDATFLASFWNYQALFNNGELEFFCDSSVINPVKDAIMANPGWMQEHGKRFLKEDPNLVLWVPSLLLLKTWTGPKLLFYNGLWDNCKLEQYLIDNKSV